MIRFDEGASEDTIKTYEPRKLALSYVMRLIAVLKDVCDGFPIEDYGYECSPQKLEQMLGILQAMKAGVVVSRPGDMEQALKDLESGETVSLDELRETLQARDS